MEAESSPKLPQKLRHWLLRSRSSHNKVPTATVIKAPPGPCRFLGLPREIRDLIYRELLLNTHPMIVHLRRVHRFEASAKPHPAILGTNKQIHDEAASILYGENTWFSAAPVKFFYWADELYEPETSTYVVEPGPINNYLPWIKHFVLFPEGPPDWIRDKIVKPGEVDLMLRRMGIQRHNLKQLIIGVASQEMSEEIAYENRDWLDPADEVDMQRKFSWFVQRGSQPAFWLVST
ncbi:uncharacterized protein CC84DRAFT_1166063 [Paraphaeosphaeria sporulosa]|uniref:Uncharacterized protein n=1 Tax=Paraphaeosphaeria sporulosa TaxID=1460663 RepID=A0A177CAT9_9PLEO|nr:uncharacterized protein CC84DRAFT_1166063 [Paraphaeosphaeria sporulosa]OAG03908.1 hypothetical protein CC84DRAFT_1166063 [Paraphaeosphaeria sporulosa]